MNINSPSKTLLLKWNDEVVKLIKLSTQKKSGIYTNYPPKTKEPDTYRVVRRSYSNKFDARLQPKTKYMSTISILGKCLNHENIANKKESTKTLVGHRSNKESSSKVTSFRESQWKPKLILKKAKLSHRYIVPITNLKAKEKFKRNFETLSQCGDFKKIGSPFITELKSPKGKYNQEEFINISSSNGSEENYEVKDKVPPLIEYLSDPILVQTKKEPKMNLKIIKETNYAKYNESLFKNEISKIRKAKHHLIFSDIESKAKHGENALMSISLFHKSLNGRRNSNCDFISRRNSLEYFPLLLSKMHTEFRKKQLFDVIHLKKVFAYKSIPCSVLALERGLVLPEALEYDLCKGFCTPGSHLLSKHSLLT